MTPQSNMQPPVAPAAEQGGAGNFSEEEIQQIAQETGYTPEQCRADAIRTGAKTKEELYPQFYSGQGIQPMAPPAAVAGPGAPVTPVAGGMDSPAEEAMEPPQSPGQEMAEGEGLSPEGLEAMKASMSKTAPDYRRRSLPRRG